VIAPSLSASGPWAIAHRGASRDRPENTIAAFDEALRQRCDAIELDLQLTRDGIPVVYHDRTLHKITGRRHRVATRELSELLRLDAGAWFHRRFAGQRIPTLTEVLARYSARTHLFIELKLRSGHATRLRLARTVAEIVRQAGATDRVHLLCFDLELLEEATRTAREVRTVLNVGRAIPRGAISGERLARLDALSVNVRALTRPVVGVARRLGLPLLVFTCNSETDVDRALGAGAQGVMSDRPGWLRSMLDRKQVGS
jgi:glycerophosphoryl diester phosphodiesterase